MFRIFKKQTDPRVRLLYDAAVRGARTPAFYQSFGVPDTLDGRFDMVVFHIAPLIDRMRDGEGRITDEGQALFDTFVEDMEQNLRSLGVSDTTFPKKMKKIGQAFYGRFDAYRMSVADDARLREAIARNVLEDAQAADSAPVYALAAYFRAVHAAAADRDLLSGYTFPDPAPFLAAAPHGERVGA